MIKPGDIPDELISEVEDGIDDPYPKNLVAAILKAAIEAGLVSPPVVVDRDTLGKIRKTPIGTIRVSPGRPVMSSQEHWRGQTS